MINLWIRSIKGRRLAALTLLFIVMALFLTGFETHTFADGKINKPETEAVSALLFDARRGQVILSKNPDEITHTPLVNRIMSALIAVEKVDVEALVTASKDVVNTEGATLKLSVGEKYAVKDLLYALLLTGSPDAAKAIAEYVGGSEEGFVSLMNEYTAKLGMAKTHFTNSNGAYDDAQSTTAGDIATLVKYALSNVTFDRFFNTRAKPWYDDQKTLLLTNTNNMFWSYTNTDGGLTASSNEDFQSIITTVTNNNMRLVCLLLDVPTIGMYNDSISILDYGFNNYMYGTLVSAGSIQKSITVEGQALNLIPAADIHYIYPKGQNFIKDYAINVDESKLKPPVTKKTIVGMLTYTLSDETVINVELYPDREILPQKTKSQVLKERLLESKELVYVIIGLAVLEIIIGLFKLSGVLKKQFIKMKVRRRRRF